MATISDRQKIRARVILGTETFDGLMVQTPNVVSFNVRRARNQPSANFSASLRIKNTELDAIGLGVIIETRVLPGTWTRIFTGVVEKAVLNPIRTDASMVMLNISGRDAMRILETQKINRRVKTYREAGIPPQRYAVVNSVIKHNTSKIERFKIKITDHRPKAVQELPQTPLENVPEAFRLRKNIDRSIDSPTEGGIETTKIQE